MVKKTIYLFLENSKIVQKIINRILRYYIYNIIRIAMPLSKAHSLNIVFGTGPNNIGKDSEKRRFGGRLFRRRLSSSSSRVHNGASVLYSTRSTGKVSR